MLAACATLYKYIIMQKQINYLYSVPHIMPAFTMSVGAVEWCCDDRLVNQRLVPKRVVISIKLQPHVARAVNHVHVLSAETQEQERNTN